MLSYNEALDYLYSFVDYSRTHLDKATAATFDLARMRALLRALGDPHTRYPTVHVAGTKGKGSVAALCASALQAAGYRTGLYTSPHLIEFNERIQINGASIANEAVAELVTALREPVATIPGLTTFELMTALGFWHFAREKVEIAVIEVGLGGRLDATNVLTPHVSIITALSYDHTHILGNTLAEIAAEKGGIIKPGVPVVSAPQEPEALAVLENLCTERQAPLQVVGRDWVVTPGDQALTGQTFQVGAPGKPPVTLPLALLGPHQLENGAVAYAALGSLRKTGFELNIQAIAAGFQAVQWSGRFQVLRTAPALVLDGAHNRASAQRLTQTLQAYFPNRRVTLIFGVSADKDVNGILTTLLAPAVGVQHIWVAQAAHPRAQDPATVATQINAALPVTVVPRMAEALPQALAQATPDEVVLVTGSLFVVADALSWWKTQSA